jgi:outer membrane protein
MKLLQDSLQVAMDQLSGEYDKASPARKRELQDLLAARNQEINNFRSANERQMEKLRAEKMKPVVEKANVFVSEYGKKHRYKVILGAGGGGVILYGAQSCDITDDVVKGLNERYK